MTTQAYYKDRLGFDPNDPREMSSLDPTLHGYEENLSKFKGNKQTNNNSLARRWWYQTTIVSLSLSVRLLMRSSSCQRDYKSGESSAWT